ncbi:DUF1194 domain-containing protein [Tabrizicola sp. BL-A-41-H6]|uniref:DUF1194 domain-containing protein n=1 Tax=Tabrizicola sp. BL-A-41-H6 TaxID=3421107 RepID=UPI003D66A338
MAEARCADLALVLAIDSSGSIDDSEYALQRHGYANAFRTPKVLAALQGAGTVDLSVVFWGDSAMPVQVLPWQRVDRRKGAERLADAIEVAPRQVTGNTAIGNGLWVALDLLDDPTRCAYRSLINVSGDGVESLGPRPDGITLHHSRERARAEGVTINALAISDKNGVLADWFRKEVITGPGSFVIQITTFADFADAIAEKIAREIGPPALAALQP